VRRWLKTTAWPASRLSALLLVAPSTQIGESTVDGLVLLPLSANHDAASAVTDDRELTVRRLALRIKTDFVLPEFLVGWLNSPLGREARARPSDPQARAPSSTPFGLSRERSFNSAMS